MSDYPDFTITALLKGLYAGDPKALAVDVEGNLSALIKGWYGTTPMPLNLDIDGNITAMLKALNVAAPINVQADAGGNIQVTLIAQELSELINRFKYGAPDVSSFADSVLAGNTEEIFSVAAKGQIYSAYVNLESTGSLALASVESQLDAQSMEAITLADMMERQLVLGTKHPVVLTRYDDVNYKYTVMIMPGFTFESGCEIYIVNGSATDIDFDGKFYYSTI